MNEKRIYAIKDMRTGKLVYNLTRRHKKYYESRYYAQRAIDESFYKNKSRFKVITFELTEVSEND